MDQFQKQLDEIQEFGVVQSIVHPIVFVAGLPGASLFEIILFETGELGQVFLMEKNQVHVLSFSSTPIKVGTKCTRTNHFAQVPVGPELFGKIIDPLGNPFSESETYTKPKEFRELEARAPGIGDRAKITKPSGV
jgi:F-type H+-transporting ATPase subunit alpha